MKRILLFIFIVTISSCGPSTVTRVLGSQSEKFDELELKNKSKAWFFACDFDSTCFFEQTGEIVNETCIDYKDYGLRDQTTCEESLKRVFLALYQDNRQNIGH